MLHIPRQFPEHSSCRPQGFCVLSVHCAIVYNLHGLVLQPSIRSSWRNWHLVLISAMHAQSSNGDEPFAKVKSLISEMISRPKDVASADAIHKAYCDKELSSGPCSLRCSSSSRPHTVAACCTRSSCSSKWVR